MLSFMNHHKPIVPYNSFNNYIIFPIKVRSSIIPHFAAAIRLWLKKRPLDVLTLDFSNVKNPYSNGMLAIISTIHNLREKGHRIKVLLPDDKDSRRIFRSVNWAHLLDPQYPRSESVHDRHMVARQFTDYKAISAITNDFMDVVLRNMSIPSEI